MEWVKLGDVVEFIRNGANIKQYDGAGGLPISRIKTIADRDINFNRVGYANINTSDFSDYYLKKGDILMSHINSEKHLAKTAYFDSDKTLIHGMNLLCVRSKNELDSKYLFYYLNSPNFLIQIPSITKKLVNQASFNVKDLKNIKILIHEKIKQKLIVKKLELVNSIISTRKSQITALDDLVQSVFYEMFEENNKYSKKFTLTSLNKFGKVRSSKRVFKADYVEYGVPFYRGKEISELAKNKSIEIELFISKDKYKELRDISGVPSVGDLLITSVVTIGNIWIVNNNEPFYFKDGNILWFYQIQTYVIVNI